jgi:hypothetical protein
MKIFTNLPGNLRALFGFLRLMTIVMAAIWFLTLTFSTWIQNRYVDEPKLIVHVGEVSLPTEPNSVGLQSNSAKPGALGLGSVRGTLYMDLCSKDAELVSALRWTMIPTMAVCVAFFLVLFGSLRSVCANIERGEVFSENNLRLVRRVGGILIAYGLAGFVLQFWASRVMGGYLNQHVVLTGLKTRLPIPGGAGLFHFSIPAEIFSFPSSLMTGFLVLVVSEAFRQGLRLKTENDLTV